ncbi:DNA methylase [Nocardia asteroides]
MTGLAVQAAFTWPSAEPVTGRRPRLLDLYCASGGVSVGYHRAGFDVTGVDIAVQPDYPFTFHQGDAIEFLNAHGQDFDAVVASPPCQAYTTLTLGTHRDRPCTYPKLIDPTRAALIRNGRPWVIENVVPAPIRRDVVLCGEMFGLDVIRHRAFELGGWWAPRPIHPRHRGRVAGYRHGQLFDGPYLGVHGHGGGKGSVAQWQAAMGIDWTSNRRSLAEAIPPAYTEWLGGHLLDHLVGQEAAA